MVRSPSGPVRVMRTFFGFATAGATTAHRIRATRAVARPAVRRRRAAPSRPPRRGSVADDLDVDQRRIEDVDARIVVFRIGRDEGEPGTRRIVVAGEAVDLL